MDHLVRLNYHSMETELNSLDAIPKDQNKFQKSQSNLKSLESLFIISSEIPPLLAYQILSVAFLSCSFVTSKIVRKTLYLGIPIDFACPSKRDNLSVLIRAKFIESLLFSNFLVSKARSSSTTAFDIFVMIYF